MLPINAGAPAPNLFPKPVDINRWHGRAISEIKECKKKLEALLPDNAVQKKIDALGQEIRDKFAPLESFNQKLQSNGNGAWHTKLALFLCKLPVRVARNIIQLLYQTIKATLYIAIHPLKASIHAVKQFILLVEALTHPETWTKLGVSIAGASLGQSAINGNALSLIGVGIGTAMAIGGLTIAALHKNLLEETKNLPEIFLTSFCIGLLLGAIEQKPAPKPVAKPMPQALTQSPQFNFQELFNVINRLTGTNQTPLPQDPLVFPPSSSIERRVKNLKG